jgi:hypothetical protein
MDLKEFCRAALVPESERCSSPKDLWRGTFVLPGSPPILHRLSWVLSLRRQRQRSAPLMPARPLLSYEWKAWLDPYFRFSEYYHIHINDWEGAPLTQVQFGGMEPPVMYAVYNLHRVLHLRFIFKMEDDIAYPA